jgi:PII-like signaling protein
MDVELWRGEHEMLTKGAAKKVTIYVNEDTRYHLGPLYEAILAFLLHKGVAGATASRAMAGFGAHQMMHTTKIEVLTEHLPIRIEFVESEQKVQEILPTLYDMVTDGLIEVQDTTIIKSAMKEKKAEPRQAHEKIQKKAKMMRIYLGEGDRWEDQPLYEAIIQRLRMLDISGATVHRGVLGYGAKGHTHKQSFWHLSRDLPIMIAVIDSEEKLREAGDILETMLEDGLIVTSDVELIRLVHTRTLKEGSDATQPAG